MPTVFMANLFFKSTVRGHLIDFLYKKETNLKWNTRAETHH